MQISRLPLVGDRFRPLLKTEMYSIYRLSHIHLAQGAHPRNALSGSPLARPLLPGTAGGRGKCQLSPSRESHHVSLWSRGKALVGPEWNFKQSPSFAHSFPVLPPFPPRPLPSARKGRCSMWGAGWGGVGRGPPLQVEEGQGVEGRLLRDRGRGRGWVGEGKGAGADAQAGRSGSPADTKAH